MHHSELFPGQSSSELNDQIWYLVTFSSAGQLVSSKVDCFSALVGQLDTLQVLIQWLNEHLHWHCVLLQQNASSIPWNNRLNRFVKECIMISLQCVNLSKSEKTQPAQ